MQQRLAISPETGGYDLVSIDLEGKVVFDGCWSGVGALVRS